MKKVLFVEEGDELKEGDQYLCTECFRGVLWENPIEESDGMMKRTGYFCDNSLCGAIHEVYEVSLIVRPMKDKKSSFKDAGEYIRP